MNKPNVIAVLVARAGIAFDLQLGDGECSVQVGWLFTRTKTSER